MVNCGSIVSTTALVRSTSQVGSAMKTRLIPRCPFIRGEEGEFFDARVALLCQQHRCRGLAEKPEVGKILAGRRDAGDAEVLLEVILGVSSGPDVAGLLEVLEHE